MAYEIELKARIDDPPGIERELEKRCTFERKLEKRDAYYRFPPGAPDSERTIRIRREEGASFAASKVKNVVGDLEENEELEFALAEPDKFEELLRVMGCSFYIKKEKRGKRFRKGGLVLELCEVAGLGWFLEIEKVLERKTPEAVSAARREILLILKELGISEDRIETRFYSDMLMELQAGEEGKSLSP